MVNKTFSLGEHVIGGGSCFIIAEVAQAHDGSLGIAHSYIDAISKTGAHAVKFQTHIADAESSKLEPWRVQFSYQDETRYDYWKRMEFTQEQWVGLKRHAEEVGLVFLSSPFSIEALELLEEIGVVAWKISSGEINNELLLHRIRETQKPVFISTGMSSIIEVDRAYQILVEKCPDICVMQCTTSYPTPPEEIGLNLLDDYKTNYNCPVGFSDHSGTIYAGIAAAAIGVDVLEIHVTFDREIFGPDVVASITVNELKNLVSGIDFVERMKFNPVDKDVICDKFTATKEIFGRSLFFRCDLNSGSTLTEGHFMLRKPGFGIPYSELNNIIGKTLLKNVLTGKILEDSDFL